MIDQQKTMLDNNESTVIVNAERKSTETGATIQITEPMNTKETPEQLFLQFPQLSLDDQQNPSTTDKLFCLWTGFTARTKDIDEDITEDSLIHQFLFNFESCEVATRYRYIMCKKKFCFACDNDEMSMLFDKEPVKDDRDLFVWNSCITVLKQKSSQCDLFKDADMFSKCDSFVFILFAPAHNATDAISQLKSMHRCAHEEEFSPPKQKSFNFA